MTTETIQADTRPDQVNISRLWWAGPLTVVVAVLANVLIQLLVTALLNVDPDFVPLQTGRVIFLTAVGVAGAVIVFALLGRFARRPIRLFRIIAIVVLLLSLLPDIALLVFQPFPGATILTVGTLMLMHVAAAVITVAMLEKLTRRA